MLLNFLLPSSVITWNELAHKFLAKYFIPSKTIKLIDNITYFTQIEIELIYGSWERFKKMPKKFPHYTLPDWFVIQIFYNGIVGYLREIINAAVEGSLIFKPFKEAYELIEKWLLIILSGL